MTHAAGLNPARPEGGVSHDLLRRRLTSQRLAGPPLWGPAGAVSVTRRLLAIQAQDPRGARLAIRARTV